MSNLCRSMEVGNKRRLLCRYADTSKGHTDGLWYKYAHTLSIGLSKKVSQELNVISRIAVRDRDSLCIRDQPSHKLRKFVTLSIAARAGKSTSAQRDPPNAAEHASFLHDVQHCSRIDLRTNARFVPVTGALAPCIGVTVSEWGCDSSRYRVVPHCKGDVEKVCLNGKALRFCAAGYDWKWVIGKHLSVTRRHQRSQKGKF
ncbi:hypothetical protein DM02DRAFT_704422 [Periconia macrospinosa]|uniref:Uncharacterized protein n=1 Tax=Periconia macrospinosa TaxID=97972 RepID=A0A2V1D0P2_9PLEO|nr:hypothetical protein DM02DRAFT_704422 [Periconia macrospinosa]